MSFLLSDYTVSAINIVYTVLDQDSQCGNNRIVCLKKWNLLGVPVLHMCSLYQRLQNVSLVCFVLLM